MKRYVKVLAAGSIVGLQSLPGYISVAAAQNAELPPVTVSGSSSGGGCYPNCGSHYSGGGNSSSGSQNVPENEFQMGPPAPPPPKSPEQKQREREKCESDRNDFRTEATTIYQAQMGVCASGNSTSYGYFIDQWKRFTGEVLSIGPGSCSVELTRNYNSLLNVIDQRRDRCVAAANQG